MEFRGSAEDIGMIIHAHPSLSEALKDAALGSTSARSTPPPRGPFLRRRTSSRSTSRASQAPRLRLRLVAVARGRAAAAPARGVERVQEERSSSALRRLLVKPPLPKGVYLWGPVGRGKSFLMDAFYLCVPLVRKRRVHFHHFMREIHRELDELKGTEDPIAEVAARTARRYRLVCFDEFHVSDIADAMILGRFLEQMMERGVEFVMTSNYHPDQLYPDRPAARALPAGDRAHQVAARRGGGGQRHRLPAAEDGAVQVYHLERCAAFAAIFEALKDVEDEKPSARRRRPHHPYRKRAGGLVWFDFAGAVRRAALLRRLRRPDQALPHRDAFRRAADVGEAVRRRAALHLAGRRALRRARQARALGRGRPEELFTEGENAAEFQRTVSRLHEMQSVEYRAERRHLGGDCAAVRSSKAGTLGALCSAASRRSIAGHSSTPYGRRVPAGRGARFVQDFL